MKKQYIVQKYVMADTVEEALRKAKKLPYHEVFLHGEHFNKCLNSEFYMPEVHKIGLEAPK